MVTVPPTAYFAHFTNDGDEGDAAEDVWNQVEIAEKEGADRTRLR